MLFRSFHVDPGQESELRYWDESLAVLAIQMIRHHGRKDAAVCKKWERRAGAWTTVRLIEGFESASFRHFPILSRAFNSG